MDNNNLSVSAEQYKGSDIYKGIHNDNLEKDSLTKAEFTEKPNPKEGDGKVAPPTVEETHKDESKALELKQEAAAKMDRKFSYDSLPTSEKRALRILLNIEGKSAKEKIEGVMEHFGVSKLGAINILADATNHIKDEFPEEAAAADGEIPEEGMEDPNEKETHTMPDGKEMAGKEHPKGDKYADNIKKMDKNRDPEGIEKGISNDMCKAFGLDGDYLEKGKALPIGTINKYGEIKTGDGWKHIKNHEKGEHHNEAISHAKKSGEHITPDHDKHPNKMGGTRLDGGGEKKTSTGHKEGDEVLWPSDHKNTNLAGRGGYISKVKGDGHVLVNMHDNDNSESAHQSVMEEHLPSKTTTGEKKEPSFAEKMADAMGTAYGNKTGEKKGMSKTPHSDMEAKKAKQAAFDKKTAEGYAQPGSKVEEQQVRESIAKKKADKSGTREGFQKVEKESPTREGFQESPEKTAELDNKMASELKELKESATKGNLDDAGHDRIAELESQLDTSEPTNKPPTGKDTMPKVGSSVTIDQKGAKLISLQPFEGKDLKVEKIVDTGLISEPQQVKVTDGQGNSIIVSPSDLKQGGSKEGSFDEKAHTKKAEQLNKEKKDLKHAAWAKPSEEATKKHEAKEAEVKAHRAVKKEAQKKKIQDTVDKVTGGGDAKGKYSHLSDEKLSEMWSSHAPQGDTYPGTKEFPEIHKEFVKRQK